MNLRLKLFGEENTMGLPKYDMNVWITERDKKLLFDGRPEPNAPQYVKLECKDVLGRFILFAKLATINPHSEPTDGNVWVPKALTHHLWMIGNKTSVECSLVDVEDIQVAESVVIKLDPAAVANWSDDEIQTAEGFAKTANRIAFDAQKLFVKPGTKHVIVGEVESIYPKIGDHATLYKVNAETKINFTGLPANRQKVIDFSQIGGLTEIINRLREIIQIPINYPDLLERFGIKPPKGMLMYGPPGNGKTMIAKAVAYSMGSAFITIEGPELMSKYVSVGEQRLREKFEEAEAKGNCVIFIDEIDSITAKRSESSAEYQVSMVATLLTLMDGMKSSSKVFVIGATNRLNSIDPALRRPGRFDLEFEVPLPNLSARYDILTKYIKLEKQSLFQHEVTKDTLYMLSELTNGYSGADISLLYREAVMGTIRKNIEVDSQTGKIALKNAPEDIRLGSIDFFEALRGITPTSLRGIDVNKPEVRWENLIGLASPCEQLENIYQKIGEQIVSSTFSRRSSWLNLILLGEKGAGKRTFAYAFAQKFNYEVLELDFLDLISLSSEEAFRFIEELMVKCKQIAPTLLLIKNLNKVGQADLYGHKLVNELNKLNKHQNVMAILLAENYACVPEAVLGYKAFEHIINIDQKVENFKPVLKERFGGLADTCIKPGMTIGQAIITIQEQL